MLRNRLTGDGTLLLNAEFRWKFWHFTLFGSECYLAANAYSDAGMVVQEREVDTRGVPSDVNLADYFFTGPEFPHVTLGGGLHLAFNRNTVISADFGKALNNQDGNLGFYLGIGWLF
jgi:hypothetical protein